MYCLAWRDGCTRAAFPLCWCVKPSSTAAHAHTNHPSSAVCSPDGRLSCCICISPKVLGTQTTSLVSLFSVTRIIDYILLKHQYVPWSSFKAKITAGLSEDHPDHSCSYFLPFILEKAIWCCKPPVQTKHVPSIIMFLKSRVMWFSLLGEY